MSDTANFQDPDFSTGAEAFQGEAPIFFDDHVILTLAERHPGKPSKSDKTELAEGRLMLFPDRLEFFYGKGSFVWRVDEVKQLRYMERESLRKTRRHQLELHVREAGGQRTFLMRGRVLLDLGKYASEFKRLIG